MVTVRREVYEDYAAMVGDGIDPRDLDQVYKWEAASNRRALTDWINIRGEREYLRGVHEGFEPQNFYWLLLVRNLDYTGSQPDPTTGFLPAGQDTKYLTRQDEHGDERLVLFSSEDKVRQFNYFHAELDEDGYVYTGGMSFRAPVAEIRDTVFGGASEEGVIVDPGPDDTGTVMSIGELE